MSPMWVLVVLWVLFVLAGLNFLLPVFRACAGFLRIALYGYVDHRGMVINWNARRRLLNGFVGAALPPVLAGVVLCMIIAVALLLAQLR